MQLNEMLTSGMQAASSKGSDLLGRPVAITLKGVQQGGVESASSLSGLNLAMPVSFSQDATGAGVVLLDARYAALIAELMFENDPPELPAELSDLQVTAAAEALGQIASAIGDGMGRATRRKVSVAAGDLMSVPGDMVGIVRGAVKDSRIAVADCEIQIGSHAATRLALVIGGSLADSLVADKPAAPVASAPEVALGTPQGGVRVQQAQFGSFPGAGGAEMQSVGNLDLLLDVPLEITVELGRANRRVRDVLNLGPGSIVELSKLAGEPVDLLVNGKPIAKGEVVVIDENFAVRIIEILAREDRLSGGI